MSPESLSPQKACNVNASPLLNTWCPPCGLDYPVNLDLKDGTTRQVRQAAFWLSERSESRERHFWLHYDDGGRFYATEQIRDEGKVTAKTTAIIQPGRAMQLLFTRLLSDDVFRRSACAHLESPQFGFIDEIGTGAAPHGGKDKVRKKKRKPAEAFHQQLLLATALVECVRKLDADPNIENLADACRSASAVHQAIHAPENFKLAAHS